MKLGKFEDYVKISSVDPRNFEKRVAFCGVSTCPDVFKKISFPQESTHDIPTIIWSDPGVNESAKLTGLPTMQKVYLDFEGEKFLPKSTKDRSRIKDLKFPIVGVGAAGSQEFKTYGKFKKSEKFFPVFREKISPITRFESIVHKTEPIHLQEKINRLGFDMDLSRFRHLDLLEGIASKLNEQYGLNFYQISLLESEDGLYLENVSTSAELSPAQSIKMYERAYESFYETRLPAWFKKGLFESYVKPYYRKRYYDAALIKPKNSISFEKYLD